MTRLLEHLSTARARRKLLVPYLMAGAPDRSASEEALKEVAPYADLIEVGLPYSDPLMDGPVIASAGETALRGGTGPLEALATVAKVSGPRVVMTYYNPIHRVGEEAFCAAVADAGGWGLIVPDIPVEEAGELRAAAAAHGLAWIPLVAPTSSPERVALITETCTGFVYAVSTLGVTGGRARLAESARHVVAACRLTTDLPVLVGIGVSTPEQAVEAAAEADGVVVGSAFVRRVTEEGPAAAGSFAAALREALDGAFAPSS